MNRSRTEDRFIHGGGGVERRGRVAEDLLAKTEREGLIR